ncbi:hypothetical protein APHDU1_0463 [Anaplasma phagocytophilum]|nr:hypothetical protein APHHGE2_1484 [Anaplasma phagocytophilum str. HGE2]KKA00523.1 hypothetical protein APHDU1_0463 [Anaplasma phagocytophilum]
MNAERLLRVIALRKVYRLWSSRSIAALAVIAPLIGVSAVSQ